MSKNNNLEFNKITKKEYFLDTFNVKCLDISNKITHNNCSYYDNKAINDPTIAARSK